MKNSTFLLPGILVLTAFPLTTSAQLEVSPDTFDFGDVEVGTSVSTLVTVMNMGAAEEVLDVAISGSADFAIASSVPATISPGSIVYIQITFSPSAEGYAAADLAVNGLAVSSLGGMGVAYEPPPSATVADILAFFDSSVGDGTLVGSGPGKSADGRRNALRNMIEAAGDLIEDGAFEDACRQLLDAYKRCDGLPSPPEFVSGPAASTLAGMILDLVACLGC